MVEESNINIFGILNQTKSIPKEIHCKLITFATNNKISKEKEFIRALLILDGLFQKNKVNKILLTKWRGVIKSIMSSKKDVWIVFFPEEKSFIIVEKMLHSTKDIEYKFFIQRNVVEKKITEVKEQKPTVFLGAFD